MDDKQLKVERMKADLRTSEILLRDAEEKLKRGYEKGQAELDKARAEFEEKYAVLKSDVERAQVRVELDRKYLTHAEAEAERGFGQ